MEEFDPNNWFWIVGEDETRAWSSAAVAYVTAWPDDRGTRIANEVELYDALTRQGLQAKAPQRLFTLVEVTSALVRIDAAAASAVTDAAALEVVADQMRFELPPIA